jgi:hypothetical protein
MSKFNSEFSMVPPLILEELDAQMADDFREQGIVYTYGENGEILTREEVEPIKTEDE